MSDFDNELKTQTDKLQRSINCHDNKETQNTVILSNSTKPIHIDSNNTKKSNLEISLETKQRKIPSRKKLYKLLKYTFVTVAMLSIVYNFLSPTIHNTFARTTLSPVEYYQKVEKEYLDKQINTLSNLYDSYINSYNEFSNKGMGADVTLSATLDSSITKNLGLEELENLTLSMLSMETDRKMKSSIALTSGQERITSFDTFVDVEKGDIFLQVPELSESYLKTSINEIMESICMPMDIIKIAKIYPILKNNPLSHQLLNDLLKKYTYIAIDELNDVTIENNDKVVIEGITSYYTKITTNVEKETALIITQKILNTAKFDNEIINLLVDLKICTIEEYNNIIDNALDNINMVKTSTTIESTQKNDIINMLIWVDHKGAIIGRSISYTRNDENILSGYKTAREGTNVGLEAWLNTNGKDIIRTQGKLHLNQSGTSGKIKVIITPPNMDSPEIFNLSIKDAKYRKEKNLGYMNGKFTVASESLSALNVSILCNGKEKKRKINVDINQGDVNLASIAMLLKITPYVSFDLPSTTNKIYAASTQFEDYVTTQDYNKYVKKLNHKIDLDKLNAFFNEVLTDNTY